MKRILIFILIFFFPIIVLCQDYEVPIDLQMSLLEKIISLEKKISQRVKENKKINILILYQRRYKVSLNARRDILQYFDEIQDRNLNIEDLVLQDGNSLNEYLSNNSVDIIIVTPIRVIDIRKFSEISAANRVLTFSLIPSYVEDGLTVGIDLKGGKPQILINLQQAKNEGAAFSSHLLKIAKIIGN